MHHRWITRWGRLSVLRPGQLGQATLSCMYMFELVEDIGAVPAADLGVCARAAAPL
jgi:hypothetical protein